MKRYPKISIITVTHNSEKYLEETILSVLSQNYTNLEYIIIDGASNDGTIDIIKKYEKSLSYWITEPDHGMYFALQKGFEKSTGELMAWINSDDKYHQGAFYSVAEIFTTFSDVDWIVGQPSFYNKEGLCTKIDPPNRWSFNRFATGDYKWIQQESVFWRRTLWDNAGSCINTNFKFAADFELWSRFFLTSKLYSLNTSISGFRIHSNQLSDINKKQYELEANQVYKDLRFKKNIKTSLNKILFNIKESLLGSKSKMIVFIGISIGSFLKRLYNYPNLITYDFFEGKWEK
jgi:glycosyltransferase involved in cell wall biosynthesis